MRKLTKFAAGLFFIALLSASVAARPLGSEWRLFEMKVDGRNFKLTENVPTLIFGEENRVSGNAGCNRYASTYSYLRKQNVKFKPFISTRMACLDARQNEQEMIFLKVFERMERLLQSKEYMVFTDKSKRNHLKFALVSLNAGAAE